MDRKIKGVYIIWHIDKPTLFYIGGSTRCIRGRINCHLNKLRKNKHFNKRLQNIVNKYGLDGIEYKILEKIDSDSYEIIANIEDYYIDLYKQKYGNVINAYSNRILGSYGSVLGRKNISERMKQNNPMKNPKTVEKVQNTLKQKPRLKVRQYDIDGNLVKIWGSTAEASKELDIDSSNICRGCNHNRKAGNYVWIYDKDYTAEKINIKIKSIKNKTGSKHNKKQKIQRDYQKTARKIYQINKNGDIVNEFNSTKDAALAIGVDDSNINKCINSKVKVCKDHIWIYKDEFSKELLDEKVKLANTKKKVSDSFRKKIGKVGEKPVYQLDIKGNIIEKFDSCRKAGSIIGIDESNINRAANGNNKSSGGFLWIFVSDYNAENIELKVKEFYNRQQKTKKDK